MIKNNIIAVDNMLNNVIIVVVDYRLIVLMIIKSITSKKLFQGLCMD